MNGPSHRTLAQMAGVSTFTVSLALRNNPRVAAATRQKIQQLAEQHGYKPNAELAELMARTRATGSTKYQATLAYIDASYPRVRKHYALQSYRESCREKAEKLGYRLDFFEVEDLETPPRALERILVSRGIRGLIFVWPSHIGIPESWKFLWSKRTCVFLATRPKHPSLPFVKSDHFTAGELSYQKAFAAGHRRIGVVLDPRLDDISEGRFIGGILLQHRLLNPSSTLLTHEYEERAKDSLLKYYGQNPPEAVIRELDESAKASLLEWHATFRPDCIITMKLETMRMLKEGGLRIPEDVSVIHWDVEPLIYDVLAGPEAHPIPLAQAAIEQLVSQIHHGESSESTSQKCVLVEPQWRDGPSLRQANVSTSKHKGK